MVRETRAGASRAAVPPVSPGIKRKRGSGSRSPVKAADTTNSLKVMLPSPASLSKGNIDGSPAQPTDHNANGDSEPDTKRQKITLKISSNGSNASPTKQADGTLGRTELGDVKEENGPAERATSEAKLEERGNEKGKKRSSLLSEELRAALALVIAQMAVQLPPPMNKILTLWLPPDFKEIKENTLGHVLRQDTLTWEALVDLLHVFCENLLVPCSYPNPMPSLENFYDPVPALSSHYTPHAIYNFCACVYTLMYRIRPTADGRGTVGSAGFSGETRWALMQKNELGNANAGEWFTAPSDPRSVEATYKRLKSKGETMEPTLLETLAARGNSFGSATPVAIHVATSSRAQASSSRTLSDSIIQKASLKAKEWKMKREAKRGGFGSIVKPVTFLGMKNDSWRPTFGPTYDSSDSSGGAGLYSTVDAMYERSWHRQWVRAAKEAAESKPGDGWWGLDPLPEKEVGVDSADMSTTDTARDNSIDGILHANLALIDELQMWQQFRVETGTTAVATERELLVAEELLASLSRLAGNLKPADLLESAGTKEGLAHSLAERLLPVSSPSIRGTLDPRRSRAIHENSTMRTRSPAIPQTPNAGAGATSLGRTSFSGPSSAQSYPSALNSTVYNRSPQANNSGAGRTGPPQYAPYGQSSSSAMAFRPMSSAQTGTYGSPNGQNAPGNTMYNRSGPVGQSPTHSTAYSVRPNGYGMGQGMGTPVGPGPGPSNLRQSFGPVSPTAYRTGGYGSAGSIGHAVFRP